MVKFNKARAQHLLNCLAAGTPIEPEHEGWNGNDMLVLAGACFFGALSEGPESFWCPDIPKTQHPEYREAEEASFSNHLHAAVQCYGHLTMLVLDRAYDEGYEANVKALVAQEGDVHKTVRPISGIKAPGEAN